MLYLAEVQKKGGFMAAKTELKLLARQQSEQSWVAITGEEWVTSDEASTFNSGALVLVDIAGNRQVQRVQEASRQLVTILQNFSRLQDKFRAQEEEIETWKQSLTYQSQELNRREMEMEARREQLQQLEEDFEQLEGQRLEIETNRDQVTRLQEELERNRAELEGAWSHLRGEQRRLEERMEEHQSTALDPEEARRLQECTDRVASSLVALDPVRAQVDLTFVLVEQRQAFLNQKWQEVEQLRGVAGQQQSEVDRSTQELRQRWQEWHQAQASLEQAQAELKVQQHSLSLREEQARMLGVQLQAYDDLYQQTYQIAESVDCVRVAQTVDVETLEKMPVDELQSRVGELERDFEKLSHFVNDQEDELNLQQEAIDELQQQLDQDQQQGFERIEVESNLDFERQRYQMLDETLVGQRRSLRERADLLTQHQSILARRQGKAPADRGEARIDLGPVLSQLESQKQQQSEELRKLEAQIEQLRSAVAQTQDLLGPQATNQEQRRHELQELEHQHRSQLQSTSELWGKVNTFQELLQPTQDGVDALRHQLQSTLDSLTQTDQGSYTQRQAVADLQQAVQALLPASDQDAA